MADPETIPRIIFESIADKLPSGIGVQMREVATVGEMCGIVAEELDTASLIEKRLHDAVDDRFGSTVNTLHERQVELRDRFRLQKIELGKTIVSARSHGRLNPDKFVYLTALLQSRIGLAERPLNFDHAATELDRYNRMQLATPVVIWGRYDIFGRVSPTPEHPKHSGYIEQKPKVLLDQVYPDDIPSARIMVKLSDGNTHDMVSRADIATSIGTREATRDVQLWVERHSQHNRSHGRLSGTSHIRQVLRGLVILQPLEVASDERATLTVRALQGLPRGFSDDHAMLQSLLDVKVLGEEDLFLATASRTLARSPRPSRSRGTQIVDLVASDEYSDYDSMTKEEIHSARLDIREKLFNLAKVKYISTSTKTR